MRERFSVMKNHMFGTITIILLALVACGTPATSPPDQSLVAQATADAIIQNAQATADGIIKSANATVTANTMIADTNATAAAIIAHAHATAAAMNAVVAVQPASTPSPQLSSIDRSGPATYLATTTDSEGHTTLLFIDWTVQDNDEIIGSLEIAGYAMENGQLEFGYDRRPIRGHRQGSNVTIQVENLGVWDDASGVMDTDSLCIRSGGGNKCGCRLARPVGTYCLREEGQHRPLLLLTGRCHR
jgi:hypothetical protein